MTIGNKIRFYRNLRGYTQEELGEKIGLKGDRVRQYENGIRTPKADMLKTIADALDVDIAALSDINISSSEDIMHILFELEDNYLIDIEKVDGKAVIVVDDKAACNSVLNTYLNYWYDKKQVFSVDKHAYYKDPRLIEYRSWRGRFLSNEISFEKSILLNIQNTYKDEIEKLAKAKTKHCETISDLIRLVCKISPDILLGISEEPPINNVYGLVFNAEKLLNPDSYSSEFAAYKYELDYLDKLGCSCIPQIEYSGSVLKVTYFIQFPGFGAVNVMVKEWLNFARKSESYSSLAKREFEKNFENKLQTIEEFTIKELTDNGGLPPD